MRFSTLEKKELLKAAGAISFAFAILFYGPRFDAGFALAFLVSLGTVGVGFLLHELMHKFYAQRFGAWAEFRAHDQMLVLAVVFSFFGFILAAPGGVYIRGGHLSRRQHGIISLAGPLSNVVLVLVFFVLGALVPAAGLIAVYGVRINALLAVFNMIPFGIFDGAKVARWSWRAWGLGALAAGAVLFLSYSL